MYLWKRKEKNKAPPYSNTFGSYPNSSQKNTRGVSHCVLAIYNKKYLIKAKEEEELWKLKYISPCKNIPKLQKILYLKETKNPSRYYYNSIVTNLKFQHKPKNIIFQKSSYKKRVSIYGSKSLKLATIYTL
jgi:hypothetical protein